MVFTEVTKRSFFSGGGGGLLNKMEGMNLYPLQFRFFIFCGRRET